MIRVGILYLNGAGVRFDTAYYIEKHMPLAIARLSSHPGYRGVSAERGVGGGAPGSEPVYVAMCHFLFDTVENFMAAFGAHVAELQGDIPNYTDAVPVIQVSEVLISG
jgi:uncharacterized protein (TIGR02118 family)